MFNFNHPRPAGHALLTVILLLSAIATVTLFNVQYLAQQRQINQQLVRQFDRQTQTNLTKAHQMGAATGKKTNDYPSPGPEVLEFRGKNQ